MSKALRVVGTIAASVALIAATAGLAAPAVAATATTAASAGGVLGVSAATLGTIATVAGITAGVANAGAQLLAPKPIARGSPAQVVIDIEPPRPYIVGRVMTGGTLRYDAAYGPTIKKVPNPHRWQVRALSGVGPIQGVVGEFFDFEPISGFYTGFYATTQSLGARPQAAALVPPYGPAPGWNGSSRLSGIAHVGLNFLFDRDGERFANGLPVYTALCDGELLYDPRQDSTFPGGSGPCRLGQESTYVYSRNPACHLATYAFGRFQNGKRIFGLGQSADAIDWPAIVDWANDCDANEWTANVILTEGGRGADLRQQRVRNLDDLAAAGSARWFDVGGMLSVDWDRPRVPLATFTDDDILEAGGGADAVQTVRDRMNGVRPQWISPDHKWQQITGAEIIGSTYRDEDGEPLTQVWPLNGVTDGRQAGQLASYAMANSRELGPMDVQAKAKWRFYRPGDCLLIDSSLMAYQGQAVIQRRGLNPQSFAVGLTFKSETPAKHPFALGKVATPPPTPLLAQTPEERDLLAAALRRPRAVEVEFDGGETAEDLKPAEAGSNRTQTANANRVRFSLFESAQGWLVPFTQAASVAGPSAFVVAGRTFISTVPTFTAAGQFHSLANTPRFPVVPNDRLSVQARVAADAEGGGPQPASWSFYVEFWAGSSIIDSFVIADGVGATPSPLDVPPSAQFVTVPPGAERMRLVMSAVSAGAGTMRVAILEPMVTSALPGQTIHPVFTPGPNAFDAADVTADNVAFAVQGQTAWATWPGLTPPVLEAEVATARADATASLADLTAIAADGILSRDEKISARERRSNIMAEFPVWRDRAIEFGVALGLRNSYQQSYDELLAYLAAVNIDTAVNTPIVRADFVAAWVNYANARELVIDAISVIASQRASNLPLGNANRVQFSLIENGQGWGVRFSNAASFTPVTLFEVFGRRLMSSVATFSGAGQLHIIGQAGTFRVQAGERISAQSRIAVDSEGGGPQASSWVLYLEYRDASNAIIGDFVIASGTGASPSAVFSANPLANFGVVPSGAVAARMVLGATSAGAGTMRVAFLEPMVTSADALQAVHPPFTAGPNAFDAADVTTAQPVVGLLSPTTGIAISRRITSQIVAGGVLQTLDSNPITASTSGSVSTISIAAHTVFDDGGSITFSAGSIGGLLPDTLYYIYDPNPGFVGGARTYMATTNRNDLTSFGRRYVGFATTPAVGQPPLVGGGVPGGIPGDPNSNPPSPPEVLP